MNYQSRIWQEKTQPGQIILVGAGVDAKMLLKILLVVTAQRNVAQEGTQSVVVPNIFVESTSRSGHAISLLICCINMYIV